MGLTGWRERIVERTEDSVVNQFVTQTTITNTELLSGLIISAIGVASAWWHGRVLAGSPDTPIVALLGTIILLIISLLLATAGEWLLVRGVSGIDRTAGWTTAMTTVFGAVGILVSLHLSIMTSGFEHGPLIADLATIGAAVGFLVGRYDARTQRCQTSLIREQDRFTRLFNTVPNPAVHYRAEEGSTVILNANDAFTDTFGFDTAMVRGRALTEVVTPEDGSADVRGQGDTAGRRPVTTAERRLMTANGFRDFRAITVPSQANEGFCMWVDITEQKIQRRRLEVFNRVLRHDLRTDANIILAHANMLDESTAREAIRERALAMTDRGDTARRVEQALNNTTDRRPIELTGLVESCLNSIETEVAVQTNLTETTVYCSSALRIALSELIENAVEYNNSAHPTVWISTEPKTADSDGLVKISIADDGPGLPETEKAVFEAGSETALQHSDGLGLWVARWIVADLGGTVTVNDREPQGTVIELFLPASKTDQHTNTTAAA